MRLFPAEPVPPCSVFTASAHSLTRIFALLQYPDLVIYLTCLYIHTRKSDFLIIYAAKTDLTLPSFAFLETLTLQVGRSVRAAELETRCARVGHYLIVLYTYILILILGLI